VNARRSLAGGGRSKGGAFAAAAAMVTLAISAAPARAQVCHVPGGVPTVQLAVSNPSCAQVVLAAGSYDESVVVSRTLTITGAGTASTELRRPLAVTGAGTTVTAGGFAIDLGGSCHPASLVVQNGARVLVPAGNTLPIRADSVPSAPCRLFDDDFESASTQLWSATVP